MIDHNALAAQLHRAKQNPFYFFSKLRTVDADDPQTRVKPFPINKPHLQLRIQRAFTLRRYAVFKSRQMVITWTMAGVCLHDALFAAGTFVGVISQKEEMSGKILNRIKFLADNLPEHWKIGLPTIDYYRGKGNIVTKAIFHFPDQPDSIIQAFPEGAEIGRSDTISRAYWDEVGFCDDKMAHATYSALLPALGANGFLTMTSTPPRDPEHFWHKLVEGRLTEES